MNRILAAFAFLLGAVMLSLSAGAANAAYTTGTVNMRAGPGTKYAIVAVIPRGAPVAIVSCTPRRSWCQTRWGRYYGWVSGRYLSSGGYAPRIYAPGYVYPPAIILEIRPDRRWRPDRKWKRDKRWRRHKPRKSRKHRRHRPRRPLFHWDYK